MKVCYICELERKYTRENSQGQVICSMCYLEHFAS